MTYEASYRHSSSARLVGLYVFFTARRCVCYGLVSEALAYVIRNFNCYLEREGPLEVTDRHAH